MRNRTNVILQIALAGCALAATLIVGGMFIILIGKDPIDVYARMFSETLGNSYGIGQVLFKATTIICTGISAAIAFRSGLFSIGAEGQLMIGAFTMALVGFTCEELPPYILIPLSLLGGAVGGGVWGAIPGVLKARYGAHEVINTMMMNFIAAALVSYLVNNLFAVPATVHTKEIGQMAQLPRLENYLPMFKGSPVNMSLFLALALCLLAYFLFTSTRIGYELRVTGLSPTAAEYALINTRSNTILALSLSGAVAGLAGANFIMGYKHYYEIGFSDGSGFIGIAAALLARNHPLGLIVTSLFFGILEYGGLTINTIIPKDLMNILEAIIILFAMVFAKFADRIALRLQSRISVESINA